MQYQAPKGTKDVTPLESHKWQYIEATVREICKSFGFNETRTPVIEHTELFLRGVGDTTDIVQKEMYTFLDKGERSITLKPEGTAGVARMFIENSIYNEAQPTKLYYLYCPVFRYDKPQAGRLREHHQFGVEVYGAPRATMDAECISLALELFDRLGISGLAVKINSIGCGDCRPQYNARLKEYFASKSDELCETCKSRLEKNPLRILDCKEEHCKKICENAPLITDCLCDECRDHFEELKSALSALDIGYEIDPFIVRGLDYYTKTVFEIVANFEGYSGTVCGGGRYDLLLEQLGGPKMCGVGFGLGMERLLLTAELAGAQLPEKECLSVYIAAMGNEASMYAMKLANMLRKENISADTDHVGRSFKAQFKFAGKQKARFVVIIGDDEMASQTLKIKDMDQGVESSAAFEDVINEIKSKLKEGQ